MQSLDIDHKESTPLAKLTRQCIWINTAFVSLGKVFFFLFFLHAAACNPSKNADLDSSFQKHLIKVHHGVSIVKPPGISLLIKGGKAGLDCLSVAETHAFIGNVWYCKQIGSDPFVSANLIAQYGKTESHHILSPFTKGVRNRT